MGIKTILSELRLYVCNEWVAVFPSHKVRALFYKHIMKFDISSNSSVSMHCSFDAAEGLFIGNDSAINPRCRLDTRGIIEIGCNVSISQEVIILTGDHDPDSSHFSACNKKVIIEDFVWVGTRVVILPGIIIGKGAVVAAGAVVTKNVDPFTIVGGVPAKLIKLRRSDIGYKVSYHRLFQ